jgi:hypothetical protein
VMVCGHNARALPLTVMETFVCACAAQPNSIFSIFETLAARSPIIRLI